MRNYTALAAQVAARACERNEHLTALAIQNRTLSRQLREAAQNGQVEIARRNSVRESIDRIRVPGFFPTPPLVIELMLEQAETESGMSVLEPEAGAGHIAVELRKLDIVLTLIERNRGLCEILREQGFAPVCADFLEWRTEQRFDRILMNPPFENLQDIDHVLHANKFLAAGGVQVAIMGAGVFFRSDKKAVAFREWLVGRGRYEKLPRGIFKLSDRPTGVESYLVCIKNERLSL